jgi:hypothetical protein
MIGIAKSTKANHAEEPLAWPGDPTNSTRLEYAGSASLPRGRERSRKVVHTLNGPTPCCAAPVRLDPKLRYLANLAARKQRRTLSSFIEWAVEHALGEVHLESETIAQEAGRLWDVEEADRFLQLALFYPDLLTFEEQQLWKALQSSQLLSPAHSDGKWNMKLMRAHVLPVLRDLWPELTSVRGSPSDLRAWVDRVRDDVISGKIFAHISTAQTAQD